MGLEGEENKVVYFFHLFLTKIDESVKHAKFFDSIRPSAEN